ncbi:kelch repeat-containing protein [Parvularcula sp. IMCC14364]|uniref:Kelch repeat-containing protein n=1 Tax=Parvularcula sp. IMCC14364 TaxID=3067902 RepID=UPI002741EE5A|nr:kelch repeat-containing protein [Parvularcula sp. IMCC14364]
MAISNTNVTRRSFTYGAALCLTGMPGFSRAAEAGETSWQTRAPLPLKLQEIYPTVLNGKIHLAGGYMAEVDRITGVSDMHIVYDPSLDKWDLAASLPEARHHPNLVGHQGKIYALGGFKALTAQERWAAQDQSWVYTPGGDQWDTLTPAPEVHGETVCASIGDLIHVVGGRKPGGDRNQTWNDHVDTDRHLVFNPATDQWQRAAPALTRRNSAAGVVIDGLLYVAGGRTVTGGNVTDLEIYDPVEDRWRTGSPMPQGQGGLAAATVQGRLYAFGGEYFNNGGGVYRECWVYDPQTDEWAASTDMRTPRHGLGGVAIDGWIYAIGGATQAGGVGTSNLLERFRPT